MDKIKQKDSRLAEPFALYIFNGMLSAVQSMHGKGWTHRDLHCKYINNIGIVYFYLPGPKSNDVLICYAGSRQPHQFPLRLYNFT